MRAFNLLSKVDLTEEKRSEPYRGMIGDLPAAMLYDFSNAFPTLLHEWLWLVFKVLKILKDIVKVIERLYSKIFAYSSGCGDGSFLFELWVVLKLVVPSAPFCFCLESSPLLTFFFGFRMDLNARSLRFVPMILARR